MRIHGKWDYYIWLLVAGLISTGCASEPAGIKKDNRFFDLATFIEGQIVLLDSLHPQVRKKVRIGNTTEEKILPQTNWQKELELFVQVDISKPALQASYLVEEQSDRVRIYKARTDENPSVNYIRAEFDAGSGQILSLEVHISRSNYLYHSEKKIWLQCRINQQGKSQIASYWINGTQKLIFNDQVPYQIEAEIL